MDSSIGIFVLFAEDESMGKETDKEKSNSEFRTECSLSRISPCIDSDADSNQAPPSISPIPTDEEVLPPAGIEQETFVEQAREDIARINDLTRFLSSLFNLEPICVDLMNDEEETLKSPDELCHEAYEAIESKCDRSARICRTLCARVEQYHYTALETENAEDEVEEVEDEGGEEEGDVEEETEEEEVDLFKSDRKKLLGDTSIYDPVALVKNNVLLPGKPDFILSYLGNVYRFANDENRSAFLQAPMKYLSVDRPPIVGVLLNRCDQ